MRQNDLAIGEVAPRVAQQHVHSGAGRLVRVIDDWLVEQAVGSADVARMGRMDEDYSFTSIQLFPDRSKLAMAEIFVRIATIVVAVVPGKEAHAVCFQLVKAIGYLGERLIGIEDIAQREEEPESIRFGVAYLCSFGVESTR